MILETQHYVVLDFNGLTYPPKFKELVIFEDNKPTLSVNVFGYDEAGDEIFGAYYITKDEKPKRI